MSVRSGQVEATRVELFSSAPNRPALACRADASYLITGGLGVLGLEVAAWELASQYSEPNIVIMRTVPLDPGTRV